MLNRITPAGPAHAYKTYEIARPASTHWRRATCDEVECPSYIEGWVTSIDEATTLGQTQADYIRHQSGRGYIETREAGLTVFTFGAGQRCFQSDDERHRIALDREAFFTVQGGDWRKRFGQRLNHSTPDAWVNDFGDHQNQLAKRL